VEGKPSYLWFQGCMLLTKLPEKATDDNLIEATCAGMRIILWCNSWRWYVFETFYATAFLDIIREISATTVFHDEIYVPFCAL